VHSYPSRPLRRAYDYWVSEGGFSKEKARELSDDPSNTRLGFLALGVWMELITLEELKQVLPTRQSQRLACRVCLPAINLPTSNHIDDLFNFQEDIDDLEDITRLYLREQRGQSSMQTVDDAHDEAIIKELGVYSVEVRKGL